MKVFFVVHSFDRKDRGGVLKVVTDLSESFINRGRKDINVVSLGAVTEPAFQLDKDVIFHSLQMQKHNTVAYQGIHKFKWFVEAYKNLLDLVLSNKDAIWITSSPPLSLLFAYIKLRHKISVIGCDHISTLYKRSFLIGKFRIELLKQLDVMVALTPPDTEYYIKHGINGVFIPNGIDFSKIKPIENQRKYIVFVGRFHEVKQPLKAMELFINSDLFKRGFVLRMFGHGKLLDQMQQYIRDNRYEDYFEIITNESNQDNIFKDAYAMLMTSSVEGFPMVLLEAIARNVPCLAFDCPYGPATIIQNGKNGYIIEDNVDDFVNKFNKLQSLHNVNIHETIQQFSIEYVTNVWFDVFNKLAKA